MNLEKKSNYRLLSLAFAHNALGVASDTPETADWKRLGNVIRGRRDALGLTQNAGGVSPATWRKMETGKAPPYRSSSVAAVCRVLGWTPDSFDRVLEGGDPVEVGPPEGAGHQPDGMEERVASLEADIGTMKDALGSLADEMGWIKMKLDDVQPPSNGSD